jgi:transposase-like protein
LTHVATLPPFRRRPHAEPRENPPHGRYGSRGAVCFDPLALNQGKPVCPSCGGLNAYECRRPNGSLRFRCKACQGDFSLTSGTLFAFHKLPLRTYLAAIAIFCNEVKGKCALALSRDLDVQYKTAFVMAHKIREAVASEMKNANVGGGEGAIVEVDGGYFGGYVKPANHVENRVDRRLAKNQNGKR